VVVRPEERAGDENDAARAPAECGRFVPEVLTDGGAPTRRVAPCVESACKDFMPCAAGRMVLVSGVYR
jgi:hypothetical protein